MGFRYGNQEYLKIARPDEAIPKLFENEIHRYKRGFTMGIFGSQDVKMGSGKTIATASMCLESDPTFNLDRVTFSPADFLKQLADIEQKKIRGAMVICEELQSYASNRTWFSIFNKTILHAIATFRYLRAGAFFVTPMARMIDGDIQKLMRFGATSRITALGNSLMGYLKVWEVNTWNNDKDIFHKKLRFYCEETGQVIEPEEFRVFLPDRNFVRELEQKVDGYKSQFRENLQEQAEAYQQAEKVLMRRRGGFFQPKELAGRMLQDPKVVAELGARNGDIKSGVISAFYPNLSSHREVSAVQKTLQWLWQDLQGKGKTEEGTQK